jgi:hypothetical protein
LCFDPGTLSPTATIRLFGPAGQWQQMQDMCTQANNEINVEVLMIWMYLEYRQRSVAQWLYMLRAMHGSRRI